ncbi:MAG: hypothetical protein JKY48_11295 [Flavobacteriales bacterium]|nr:hypothetical protein [Flavobacteriales bacterium]
MKSFHFISIDKKYLSEINNHVCKEPIIKLHECQEDFAAYLESASENFVFLDIDFHTESENIETIVKLNQIASKVIVVSKDTSFAYHAIKTGAYDYVLKSNLIKDAPLICDQYSKNLSLIKSTTNKVAINCNDAVHYLNLNEIIRC